MKEKGSFSYNLRYVGRSKLEANARLRTTNSMTDREINTQFALLHGKLFALMASLAELMEKSNINDRASNMAEMIRIYETESNRLLQNLSSLDLADKKQ